MFIDHINIKAPSSLLEQEKNFLCAILGLHEGHRPPFSHQGYWLYASNKAIVHLSEGSVEHSREIEGHFDHIAFRTTALRKIIQKLIKMDIAYSKSYIDETDMTQIFLKTPAGIKIEVNQVSA